MEVRGGMGLFYFQRRFVFALVSMSLKVRSVIYIEYGILYRNDLKKREFVSNRLYMCNESTSTCIETTGFYFLP